MGDIDNDGLLEVVVYERNSSLLSEINTPNNIKLFKFINGKYSLTSTVQNNSEYCLSMNISKAKNDISGVFVSAAIGAHSGSQFLYITKEGELVSAIGRDINSIYPSSIKDINGDKITEPSTLEADPNDPDSSYAVCAKILTWYKWDGESDLTTVKVEETH